MSDRYQDAERDCTTALSIQKDNLKALYRRGLARKGLGKYEDAVKGLSGRGKSEADRW
jgi:tetratricopeptide (TPR) repeat protein